MLRVGEDVQQTAATPRSRSPNFVAPRASSVLAATRFAEREEGPAASRPRGEEVSGPGPARAWEAGGVGQLPLVVVLATVAGVAAVAAAVVTFVDAVVLAVVEAVVEGVVVTVAAAAGVAAEAEVAVAPLDAPAAMQPVRTAATATPANPAARRARRAGCGRRRRAVVGVGGFVEVMSHMIEQLSGTILRTVSIVALSSRDRW